MLDKKQNGEKTAVTLRCKHDCSELYVLGEFNNWQPEKMRKLKDNVFTKKYLLNNNASYQYVYFDKDLETYFADEHADKLVQNDFGTVNSVVYV